MARAKRKSRRVGDGELKPKTQISDNQGNTPRAVELAEEVIALTPVQIKDMAQWISKRVENALTSEEHTKAIQRITDCRKAYLEGVQRTNTGMQGASDYRTFLAASQADAMSSRLVSVFSTSPLIKIEGQNEMGRSNAPFAERWLEYHHNHNINLPMQGAAICPYLTIEGHAILYAPYKYEIDADSREIIKTQVYQNGEGKSRNVDPSDKTEVQKAVEDGFTATEPPQYVAEERKKPKVIKNYPDLQVRSRLDYLIPRSTKPYPLQERPVWEALKENFTYSQLKEMDSAGDLYRGAIQKLEEYLLDQAPSDDAESDQTRTNTGEDKQTIRDQVPFEKNALDAVVPCWVIRGRLYIPSEDKMMESTAIYHHPSQTLLQVKLNKLIGQPRGIFHLRMIMVPFRFEGIGTVELCLLGERAINDLANFVLDEGRIFSCLPYWYNKKRFPNGLSQFEFWKGVGVLNKDKDFGVLQFPDRRPVDLNISTFVRGHMERRSGQGDLQLGRESDVTGKQPPTARGIISILREGQVRYTLLNYCLVGELVRFAQYEMSMFQQLLGDSNMVVELLGEDGKSVFPQGLSRIQILGAFSYQANHAAQNMIRELDAELNFMLYDRMKDNKFIASSMEASYNMTRDCLLSAGKKTPLWIKPLSFYQEAAGRPSVGSMTPSEQKFAETLIQQGVPMERVKELLNQLRGQTSASPEGEPGQQDPGAQAAEASILTGGSPQETGAENDNA